LSEPGARRLLVMRPGAIGDTLLTFPALAALRGRFPGARVHLIGNGVAAPLAMMTGFPRVGASRRDIARVPLVDAWTSFDDVAVGGLFRRDGPRMAARFGPLLAAVAWCGDPDGTLAANLRRLGAEQVVVAPSRPPASAPEHISDHLLATLRPLGIRTEVRPRRFGLEVPPPLRRLADEHLSRLGLAGRPVVAVHPGSGSPAKNWPPEHLAELLRRLLPELGLAPLLLAGPADEGAAQALLDRLDAMSTRRRAGRPPILRDLPLPVLAALLSQIEAYVGNDTGPTHLAALLERPTVALFGPTDPILWAPRGPRVRVVHRQPLAELMPDAVLDALRGLMP
jgi:heptosyltransferase-3